jgi:hypothetical protein
LDSGASRCQHASARAETCPSEVRHSASGRPATVRARGPLLVTSWSQAATYQAFIGQAKILLVTEDAAVGAGCGAGRSAARSSVIVMPTPYGDRYVLVQRIPMEIVFG